MPLPRSLLLLLSTLLVSWQVLACESDAGTQAVFSTTEPTCSDELRAANANAACDELSSSLGNTIVHWTHSTEEYNFTVSNAWNYNNAKYTPTCIVLPRTARHVQTAMRAIYEAGAHYAVQAGSHSGVKGWNTVQDGVLIHFAHMQAASYNQQKQSITLEPGIHWGDATAELAPLGVTLVGGRVAGVGTGLFLGGGISFLSANQGFAADNFLELDVVLVNGTIVTATPTNEYSDLFRALKGGANRFGIVTRYEVRAVHVGTPADKPFYGGFNIYGGDKADEIVKATAKYVREINDPNATLMTLLTTSLVDGGAQRQTCIVFMFYMGTSLPEEIYGDFLGITPLMSSIGPQAWTDIVPRTDPPMFDASTRGSIQHFGSLALDGQEADFVKMLAEFRNFSDAFVTAEAGVKSNSLWMTPITRHQLEMGRKKGGNPINGERRTGPYTLIHHSQKFEAGLQAIPAEVQAGIDLVFERVPPSPDVPLYVNECDAKQNVFATYAEYDFLKATYARYDPGRFNVEHTDGPIGL
uniref:FAD-binding domain-containing protein n=1 Tax=Mycena chlorophos TaxID=658473 RepID=A0ABQ0M0F8_MYCCL|nr:FAD-binding domain-containing protein [Mycena chlorophos]